MVALISAVPFSLSWRRVLAADSSSMEACRSAFVARIDAVTESKEWRIWVVRRSRSVLASASSRKLVMMSSADMPRIAAWSTVLSFDQMGARKEKGAGLVGGARESVEMVAAVSILAVVVAVPEGEVARVLL